MLLQGVTATDSVPNPEDYQFPTFEAQGKRAHSLMQPQELAHQLLLRNLYNQLFKFTTKGCKTDCGLPWSKEVLNTAHEAGPHISALLDDSIELVWEDITYQAKAGFVKTICKSDLFNSEEHPDLKISRVAMVPQANCRGHIILNMSAKVDIQGKPTSDRQRHKK